MNLGRPLNGPRVQLGLRNLYIVPTRFGWFWLGGTLLLQLVGIQLQRNGPLLLSFLMLGLFLLTLNLTHFNLQGLELAQRCWLRVERQHFFPVPGRSRLAIFSIRLLFERLDLSAARPDRAQALHDWLASMSQAVSDYKGLTGVRPALLAWLTGQSDPHRAK
jgi:hypothetical protein